MSDPRTNEELAEIIRYGTLIKKVNGMDGFWFTDRAEGALTELVRRASARASEGEPRAPELVAVELPRTDYAGLSYAAPSSVVAPRRPTREAVKQAVQDALVEKVIFPREIHPQDQWAHSVLNTVADAVLSLLSQTETAP